MAENYSKSKLKRKRSSVEELQADICSRGAPRRSSGTPPPSRDGAAAADRSGLPAAAAAAAAATWWNELQPPAVESLWAFTLMSALPHLQSRWDPVPDLPSPPAVKPAAPKVEELGTIDFFSEVPPFPEYCPLTPQISSDLDPQSPSSAQENLSVQTSSAVKTCAGGPSSRGRPSPEQQTHQPFLNRSQRPTIYSWEKAGSSSAEQLRVSGQQEQLTGPGSRRPLTESGKVSRPPSSTGEEEEVQSVGKHEHGALQSCPMCLHVFPVGLTQMERDGHLAQCLSDMNVDMTW